MSRREDLEQAIRDSYYIIRESELTIQTSPRPEEQKERQRAIEKQWALIRGYVDEYRPLVSGDVPSDIAEIAARFLPKPAGAKTVDDSLAGLTLMATCGTIDRRQAVALFRELMRPDGPFRVLLLAGDTKLGKSHLATKVFPRLARQEHAARVAVLDLRNQALTIPDLLHAACVQLGDEASLAHYHDAHRKWLDRPAGETPSLRSLFTRRKTPGERQDTGQQMTRRLVSVFVTSLRRLDGKPLLFLFDSIDSATERTKAWLMDTLLVQLAHLNNARVVVAGQSLPDASGSYAALCYAHELIPVMERAPYLEYCRQTGVKLTEEQVQAIMTAFDYKPGLFAEVMPKFRR